ncbi:Amidase domain-containing protein [Mycena kentingensis (nom. inval.)]|nr:Amidase domain-containing protein [Mycena kentingensis (nom. inval.)]
MARWSIPSVVLALVGGILCSHVARSFLLGSNIFSLASRPALASRKDRSLPDLYEASISELQAGLDEGLFTSVDLVKAYFARTEEVNLNGPALRAVLEMNQFALSQAALLDKEREVSGKRSLLHGIPVYIKDNIATVASEGMNTTCGSYGLLGSVVPDDAEVVKRLRKAGAIILVYFPLALLASLPAMDPRRIFAGGQVPTPYPGRGRNAAPLPSAHMPLLPLPGLDIRADNTAFILTMLTNAANNNLTTRFGNPRLEHAHWEHECFVWASASSYIEAMAPNDLLYAGLFRVLSSRHQSLSGAGDADYHTCHRMFLAMTELRSVPAVRAPVQPVPSSSQVLSTRQTSIPGLNNQPPRAPFVPGQPQVSPRRLAPRFQPSARSTQFLDPVALERERRSMVGVLPFRPDPERFQRPRAVGTSSLKSATFPFVPRHVTASNPAPTAALSGGVALGPSRPATERLAPVAPNSVSDEEMPLAPPTSLTSDSPPPLASVSTSSDDSVLRESVPAPVVSAAESESLDNIVNGKPIASGPASVAASATKAVNSDTAISPLYSTPPPALATPGPSATAPSIFVFGTADASPVSEDLSFRSSSQSTAISHATVPGSVFGGLHAAAPGGSVFPLPVVAVYNTKGFAASPGAQSTAGSSTTGDSSSDAGPRPRNGGAFTSPAKYRIRTGPKSTPKLKRTLLERIGPSRSGPSTDSAA